MKKPPLFPLIAKKKLDNLLTRVDQIKDINMPDEYGKPLIAYAISEGNIPIVEYILNHGGNPNCVVDASTSTSHGFIKEVVCPLHLASSLCDVFSAELLLNFHGDIDAVSFMGFTPLMYCVSGGKPYINRTGLLRYAETSPEQRAEYCRFLIGRGANREYIAPDGTSFKKLIEEYYALPGF